MLNTGGHFKVKGEVLPVGESKPTVPSTEGGGSGCRKFLWHVLYMLQLGAAGGALAHPGGDRARCW